MTRRNATIRFGRCGSAATTALLALTTPTALGEVLFQPLGGLPGQPMGSSAIAVSDDGSVVTGWARFGNTNQAFRWTEAGGMQGLGFLSATPSYGRGISGNGQVCVGEGWVTGSHPHAYRWSAETGMVDLNNGGTQSSAYAASFDGNVVVGNATFREGRRAFRWTPDGGMANLGTLPGHSFSFARDVTTDGAVIIGSCNAAPNDQQAFRWTAETGMIGLGDLPGGLNQSYATSVSPDGSWVVGAGESETGGEAFRWSEQTGMLPLGSLPGGATLTIASAVTVGGDRIVGGAYLDEMLSISVATLWDAQHGQRRLTVALAEDYGFQLPSGWSLRGATDIASDGSVIVGIGTNPAGKAEGWRIVIPEPSTGMLLAASSIVAMINAPRRTRRRTHGE